jgi:hypothetical protein
MLQGKEWRPGWGFSGRYLESLHGSSTGLILEAAENIVAFTGIPEQESV